MDTVALTREDAAILALERGPIAGHMVKAVVLDRPVALEALRDRLAARIDGVPQMRRGLDDDARCWVDRSPVDLDAHLAEAPADQPLEEVVARTLEARLDRSVPLWSVTVACGGKAHVWAMHHAWADGHTSTQVLGALLWDEAPPAPPARPAQASEAHLARALPGVVLREVVHRPAHSPFSGHVGRRREVAFATLGLQELKQRAHTLDPPATINDALLAAVAGAIRTWAGATGHLPDLRAKVPVSLHQEGDMASNRDSWILVPLPVHEEDFMARLEAIHAYTAKRKRHHDAEVVAHLGRFVQKRTAFALNVSNVPGPRSHPTLLDVPVTAIRSVAEIGEDHALRVAAISLGDGLSIGFSVDPDLVPRVAALAEATGYAAAG